MARKKKQSDPPPAAPPAPPVSEGLAYFRNKGMQPSFSWEDVTAEEHAFVFTVAKATKIEVLNSIHDELDRAIAKGETVESFKARLGPRLIALGWWGKQEQVDPETGEVKTAQLGSPRRLETIYWHNVRVANSAGVWARAQRTKKDMPFFIRNLGNAKEHRPEHVAIAGTIRLVDDPFWDKYFAPNDWGCQCWMSQLSAAEAHKLGYDPAKPAPDLGTTTYVNRRTGETREIPVGVGPGWEANPAKLRARNLERHLQGHLDQAPEELARVATKDVISSAAFQRIARGETTGSAPVGVLPQVLQGPLGAGTHTVLFSAYTAAKGRRKHAEAAPDDYLKVQELIDSGERLGGKPHHVTLQKQIDGQWWTATLKSTGDGREVYLQTFHVSNANQAASRRKNRGLIEEKTRPEGRK